MRARYYHPVLGRFSSADTIVPDPGNPQAFNRYSYVLGNPVKYFDPSGHDPVPWWERAADKVKVAAQQAAQLAKHGLTELIVAGAEVAHTVYVPIADAVDQYPKVYDVGNAVIDPAASAIGSGINTDVDSLGWQDLFGMWLFEQGPQTIELGPENPTTQDLMRHSGVLARRQEALDRIGRGETGAKGKRFPYGVNAYFRSLADAAIDGDWTTVFTGSYYTTVDIVDNGDGTYTLNYEVRNTSGWESATRFRRVNGEHLGIVPDKDRGSYFHLGGNFDQYWRWTETIATGE